MPDASVVTVQSTADVIELMKLGQGNRAVGATAMNDRSSRSHRFHSSVSFIDMQTSVSDTYIPTKRQSLVYSQDISLSLKNLTEAVQDLSLCLFGVFFSFFP